MIKDAFGSIYHDEDDIAIIDGISGAYNQPLGHCSTPVESIIKHSLGHLDTSYREVNKSSDLLQSALNMYGHDVRYWNFLTTGSEAIERALMLVPLRHKRIIMFEGAFHGKSFMTAFANYKNIPWNQAIEVITVPWMDFDAILEHDFDAVIFEPVQGVGGNIATTEDIESLRDLCDHQGAMLIADEIYCGLWRCGKFLVSDIAKPDIVVISKGLGGPIPISAVGCLKKANPLVGWYTTNGNNALANSVALKMLPLLYNFGMVTRSIELPEWLKDAKHKIKGASFNIKVSPDCNGLEIKDRLRQANIIVGASDQYIRLAPALPMLEDHSLLTHTLKTIKEFI
jgi:acetylornithine/N-succinyldiaminopimelate aminotransferase